MDQLELSFKGDSFSVRITIDEALNIFIENYWRHLPSYSATKAHVKRLREFFKGFYLDSISKSDVEEFRRWMRCKGYSYPTINKGHMLLSRLYTKMDEYREGKSFNGVDYSRIVLPSKNPASLVPKVNERQFARKILITKKEKTILMSYADEDLSEIIDALYWTELRPSDFFRVSSDNIDIERRFISGIQHKTITTKNPSGIPYKVSIPKDKIEMITRRLKDTKPGTPIFRRKNIIKRWNKVRILAMMPDVQLRDLRGSAASFLLDNGVDPETVRKTLGHTTLRMLPIYDKRPDSGMVEATEILAK